MQILFCLDTREIQLLDGRENNAPNYGFVGKLKIAALCCWDLNISGAT